MPAEVIAVLSAMGWAADAVLVRVGARRSSVMAAAFLSYSVTALCLWIYLLIHAPSFHGRSFAALYFVLSGCLQPLLARILYYMGLVRMGVSRAGPLRATGPLFAVILAVLFLHERPNLSVYMGVFLIVGSAWLIASEKVPEETAWRPLDILYPLGAAFVAAISQNLRRAGLLMIPEPSFGAAISTSTSLVLFTVFLLSTRKTNQLRIDRKSLPYFVAAALISAAALVLNFLALNRGDVSVMAPLLNTTPLFAVFFSAVFLRDVERISWRTVLSAGFMVAGVAVIANR